MSESSVSRRHFLAASARAAGALAVLGHPLTVTRIAGQSPEPAADAGALSELLANPPHAAKPMTRWWWFGGAVTRQEITRELTFMRDAGLRGAEIQPVYPVELDDPARGIRNLRYFTPEWFDVLRHAVTEARRLGLQLDFTLGSGWPYGGPFIPTGLSARRIRVLSHDVMGPRDASWNVGPLLTGDDRVIAAVAVPVAEDASLDLARAQVLGGQPSGLMAGDVRVGTAVQGWSAPAGHWRVLLFLDSPTGMQVKRPTYGMEGLVIDHHSREAIDLFLRSAGDRVLHGIGDTGGAPFTSVFCDSLEVYGADWTRRLPEEFEKRRGYDLRPHLAALFHEAGPLTPHVRYDYHLTLSDLIIDDFFVPLVQWAEARGMTARIQAHGAMGDVMRGYGLAHIPEGESIFLGDRYAVNLKHRRLASSAAHVYERPIVSAEAYTWLRTPMFMTTLEMMKALSDALFLDGINQVVNHGYSYSPPEAGEPGWAFYASTEVNHTNTWWKHYPHVARYVQRVSALLREGTSVNPIGVYLPVADVYAGVGAGGLHIDVEVERHVDANLLNGLRRAGYDFDLLNDHALATRARVEGASLRVGTGRYAAVIVPQVQFMPPESARLLSEFARLGGHVIVIGAAPSAAPGVRDLEERSRDVREAFAPASAPGDAAGARMTLVPDLDAAIARLNASIAPDFTIRSAADEASRRDAVEHVGFTHRRTDQADVYLVANVSDRSHDLRVRFDAGHRAAERWNPETGQVEGEPPYEYVRGLDGRALTEVALPLDPFQSAFIVFGRSTHRPAVTHVDLAGRWTIARAASGTELQGTVAANGTATVRLPGGGTRRITVDDVPSAVELKGPWQLSFGTRPPIALATLPPWGDLKEGAGYSGWGTYELEFMAPELRSEIDWAIDLGTVHETAEVRLNGRTLGVAWKGRRSLPCGEALASGSNRLQIDVANLWIHHLLAHGPEDPARQLRGVGPYPALAETAGIRWGTYGEVPPERVPPCGLLGPVRLVPARRVNLPLGPGN